MKMEKRLVEKESAKKPVTPGLSVMIRGQEWQVTEGELPEAREFGTKFAA
jgi:hypothetical protein